MDENFKVDNVKLPELTPTTIQRAKEGLEAARSPGVKALTQDALQKMAAIAQSRENLKLKGSIRRFFIHLLIRSLFRVRVENLEHLPAHGAIIAANHLNHIDPFLILSEIPAYPYYYILGDNRSLYNKKWKRCLLRWSGGTIPLCRLWKEEIAIVQGAKNHPELIELANGILQDIPTGQSIQTLRQLERIIQKILTQKQGLIIFPEGRLGSQEGELLLPLKRGTVIYALRSGVPIIPIALIGTQNLYLRKELIIRLGQPLILPQLNRPKPSEIQAALDFLQEALTQLLPSNYQEADEIQLFRYFLNRMLW